MAVSDIRMIDIGGWRGTVPEEVSSTIARRTVRLALKEARDAAGYTQADVAEEMEWSLSKVIRIESGEVSIAPNDLRPLLTFLQVKDRAKINELVELTKVARKRSRSQWHQGAGVREHLTDAMRRLIEYEAEATEIRYYSVYYIPGPLQVPAYAATNLANFDDSDIPRTTRELRAEARQRRRQVVLSRLDNGLSVFALLDQSVLLRPIGGLEVFHEQLSDLHMLAEDGKIQLRMLPFDSNYTVTNNATFDLLTLSGQGGEQSEVLYRETGLLDEVVEDTSVQRHRERFDKIWEIAATVEVTVEHLSGRIKELEAAIRNANKP
jgi:transcriptional regulator with XRE-family HTH domain